MMSRTPAAANCSASLKRRNGRRTRRRRHHAPRDVHRLRRLEVGTQRHTQAVQPRPQARDVALHPVGVEDEARRRQSGESSHAVTQTLRTVSSVRQVPV